MFLLFDIGGTYTRLSIATDLNKANDPIIIPTEKKFEDFEPRLKYFVEKNIGNSQIDKIVGGIAGVIDKENSMLINSPNLENWIGKPIAETFARITGCDDVTIVNDASLGALGEAVYGAGKGYKIEGFLTIGTGVGGCRIVNEKIDENSLGFEPGHQILKISDDRNIKTLEDLVGGHSLFERYGKYADEIDDIEILDEIYFHIACGIHNTILYWSPDIIVLGGSIGEKVDIAKVKSFLNPMMKIFKKVPPIRHSELGKSNGIMGALHLSKFN